MDLTKLTTPFGLLDDETREALKAHGGPYEYANSVTDWSFKHVVHGTPRWDRDTVYRVKPQPPKPREWVLCAGILHPYDVRADYLARRHPGEDVIRLREVLPD